MLLIKIVACLLTLFVGKTFCSVLCTLSTAGVTQVSGTLTTLTTDVTTLQTAVTALASAVTTLQTAVTAIGTTTTSIDTTVVATQTTVNTIATQSAISFDVVTFLGTVMPVAYAPMAGGYAGGTFGFTSGTVLPWSGPTFLVTTFCAQNFAYSDWSLNTAWNTATTKAAFPLIVAQISSSLPTVASYNYRVTYSDSCSTSFTYGAITGTCCTDSTVHDYVYTTSTGVFTCSDQTTALFPLCAAAQNF